MTSSEIKIRKHLVIAAILAGIILYLSKFLRPDFQGNNSALFILGFLPNPGLAFALPFIYVANRIRLNKTAKHFFLVCVLTVFLMTLNEIRDKYQSGRVFDWYDILASLAGVVFAALLFHFVFKAHKQES